MKVKRIMLKFAIIIFNRANSEYIQINDYKNSSLLKNDRLDTYKLQKLY